MSAPYSPWQTRSQFKAIDPRPIVVCRIEYQCEAEGQTGTDSTSRLAAGRSRCLPGMQFVAAVLRAPLILFSRVHALQKPTRGLLESLVPTPWFGARHEHKEPQERSHEVQRKSVAGA